MQTKDSDQSNPDAPNQEAQDQVNQAQQDQTQNKQEQQDPEQAGQEPHNSEQEAPSQQSQQAAPQQQNASEPEQPADEQPAEDSQSAEAASVESDNSPVAEQQPAADQKEEPAPEPETAQEPATELDQQQKSVAESEGMLATTEQPATEEESGEGQPDSESTASDAPTMPEAPAKQPAPKVQFSSFDLAEPLAKAISDLGFEYCTPIQAQSLRYTLVGYDVTGKAQTGTGKTAAFLITLINDMLKNPITEQRYAGEPRALVLAPTRELVIQIANDATDLCKHSDLRVVTLVGGEDYQKQLRAVDKRPVDIVVATPGRLIDFLQNEHLYLGLVELLVIDEADRMLDMGFIPQVRNIVARTPHKDCRQTLLFSATFTPEILELTSRWAMDPVMIEIEPERVATDTVEQIVYLVTSDDKYKLLYNLIGLQGSEKVIVFSNRRDQVRKLADNLHRNGVSCGLLSGEIAQKKRVKTLEDFREGKLKVLVATDVAGRGLHIDDVTHVINYTLPEEAEDYVHRIGRTGRAGATGTSISFACEEDSFLLPNIESKLGQKLPCVHPDSRLLTDPPAFTRESKFKDESKPAGRGGRGGRPSGGGRPRPRR
tara:strand:- start:122205 stop:124004 length:1800 start_codon:yes stop_codon:yes gene_type:complete